MTRSTLISELERTVLARVPKRHQREVRAIQIAIVEVWNAIIDQTVTTAYAKGVSDTHEQDADRQQHGFDLGYRHGLDRAIGSVGSPARRMDDDEMTMPVS